MHSVGKYFYIDHRILWFKTKVQKITNSEWYGTQDLESNKAGNMTHLTIANNQLVDTQSGNGNISDPSSVKFKRFPSSSNALLSPTNKRQFLKFNELNFR